MVNGGVIVASRGVQHSPQAALAIQERGLLRRYVTGSYYYKRTGALARGVGLLPRAQRGRIERQLLRRRFDLLDDRLVSSSALELVHTMADRVLPPSRIGLRVFELRGAMHARRTARLVRRIRPAVVVCYDTGALEIFEAARSVGALRLLDQTTAHMTRAAASYRAAGIRYEVPERLFEVARAETRAADAIVTPSQYALDSLVDIGVPADRVIVLPYGVDLQRFRPAEGRDARSGVVRALYVGGITQRKGVHFVVEAVRRLQDPRLRLDLVGREGGDTSWLPRGDDAIVLHAPRPHREIPPMYQQADFFVQMSLHESSAMTIFEALASGLPVITSPNSGSVVRDGIEGFVIPPGDVEALMDRMTRLTDDALLRARMGRAARERAESFGWEAYRARFGALVEDLAHADVAQRDRVVAEHRARAAVWMGTDDGGLTSSGPQSRLGNRSEE